MKQIKTSRRVLSLLVGSLLAIECSAVFGSDDDELLMFVEHSKSDYQPAAVSKKTMAANDMASMLVELSKSQRAVQPVAKPAAPVARVSITPAPKAAAAPAAVALAATPSTLPVEPLLRNPTPTLSAPPQQPLLEMQAPAPIRAAAAPTPVLPVTAPTQLLPAEVPLVSQAETRVEHASPEIPVFHASGSTAAITPVAGIKSEPTLTPGPKLNVAAAPMSVVSASPAERELRAIFYRAVMIALERSPQMRGTQLQVDAAKEDVNNAKGQRWPQVDVTSNSRRYEFGGGSRSASESNMPAFGVNVATNLIDFGQTSNTIKSKEYSVKAADAQTQAKAEDLAWQVSSGLVELSKQRLIIEMSKQYVARMQELVTMLSGIVAADQGRRSELTQATGRYLQAQSALDNAVAKARDTEIQLYRLIGETQVPLPPAVQWQLQPSDLNRLLVAVDQHPTLQQARAQSQAAFAEADALKSSSLPKINWVVSKDTGKDYYGREQSWQTGINVSWGLFRGGSAKAAEQAAVQRAAAMREESEDQRDDLQQRVRAADQDARSMLQRADLYRNLTRESDRIRLDFFDQWYHLGKRTLLDVLSAESDYYNNRVAEVTNRFDGYSAIFRSYASAGELINWLKK